MKEQMSSPRIRIRGAEGLMKLAFSRDGKYLCAGTTSGIRIYSWNDVLSSTQDTPSPEFAASNQPPEELNPRSHVYDIRHDSNHNLLIYCEISGRINAMNLNTGEVKTLVEFSNNRCATNIALSRDGSALCSSSISMSKNQSGLSPLLQIWNYPALLKKAGIT